MLDGDDNLDGTPWQPLHTCTQSCTQHSLNTCFPASGCHRLFDTVRNGCEDQKKQSYTELEGGKSAEHERLAERNSEKNRTFLSSTDIASPLYSSLLRAARSVSFGIIDVFFGGGHGGTR